MQPCQPQAFKIRESDSPKTLRLLLFPFWILSLEASQLQAFLCRKWLFFLTDRARAETLNDVTGLQEL